MAAGSELLRAFATLELRGAREVEAGLKGVEAQAAKTEQTLNQRVGGAMKNLGASMTNAGKSMTTFATVPLVAAGAGMLKLASDAEETGSKFDTVFGAQAPKMNAWITDLQKIMPATRAEIQEMASSMNLTLEGMGLNEEQAAKMSQEYVKLSGDLASFNNIPVAEAHDAISAALRGEYDTLQKFVPTISAATVEQKAMEMGLANSTSEIDAQDKALAINKLLLEGTKDAQGDMARTADSTANSMKALWRDVKELGTQLGQNLIPVVTPVVQKLSELAKWVGDLSPKWQRVIVIVAAFVAAIGPVLVGFGLFLAAIGAIVAVLSGPLILAIMAAVAVIGTLAAAAFLVIRNWSKLKAFWNRHWAELKATAANGWNTIKSGIAAAWNWVRATTVNIWRGITGFIERAVSGLERGILRAWGNIRRGTSTAWNGIKAGVSAGARAVRAVVVGAWNGIKHVTSVVWNGIKVFLGGLWRGLVVLVRQSVEGWKRIISAGWNVIRGVTRAVWNGIKNFLVGLWRAMTSAITTIRKAFQAGIRKGWEWIRDFSMYIFNWWRDFLIGVWTRTTNTVTGIRERFQAGIRKGWEWIRDFSMYIFNWWRDRLVGIWQGMADRVTSIREGMQAGIRRGFEWIRDFSGDIWDTISERIVNAFSKGINKARSWLASLMQAVGNVLKALGNPGGLAEGAFRRADRLKEPIPMAKGGVVTRRDGGISSSPTVLYGEAGPEAFVRLDKKTPESQRAALAVMRSPNAPPHDLIHMAMGGILEAARGRIHDGGGGAGGFGPTANHLWDAATLKRAHRIIEKFPVSVNTYENHPPQAPQYAQSSIDAWAYRGRGTPISNYLNDQVRRFMMTELRHGLKWTLGEGDPGHSGAERHVHGTWEPEGKVASGGYVGGGGGFDWMGAITSGLAKIGAFPNVGMGLLGTGLGRFAKDLLSKAKDWLIEKAKSVFGSLGPQRGGSNEENMALGKMMNERAGWAQHWEALKELWRRESNWDHTAENPSSGAYGIPQRMPRVHGRITDFWKGSPRAQIAWGLDYIGERHGNPAGALAHHDRMNWYSEGGIAMGPQLMALAEDAGKELVLPLHGRGAKIARDALQIGEMQAEIAGLRSDLRDAGIRISQIDDQPAQQMGRAAREGAKGHLESRDGRRQVAMTATNQTTRSNRTGGGRVS